VNLPPWLNKLLGRPASSAEPPPARGLDEPIIHSPEEEAAASKDRAVDLNERLRKAEDRLAPPRDPPNP
jgi:hypothetical protein